MVKSITARFSLPALLLICFALFFCLGDAAAVKTMQPNSDNDTTKTPALFLLQLNHHSQN